MNRPRADNDFATIRARMEELRREREGTKPSEKEAQRDALVPHGWGHPLAPRDQHGARPGPTVWRDARLG